jgi:hypothetical protein
MQHFLFASTAVVYGPTGLTRVDKEHPCHPERSTIGGSVYGITKLACEKLCYEPDAHPIIRVLSRDGPSGLLSLAQRHGYSSAGGYVDGCHLCYQVRRFLRPRYPAYLALAHPYIAM